MTFDPRLHKQVAEHPYPLLFATISGRTSTDSRRPIRITTCAGFISCRCRKLSA